MVFMSKRILVAEDNDTNRKLIKDILSHYGYTVLEATNGEEAVKMARENSPDMIMMDMQMPIMDGFIAIRILKNNVLTRRIKIIGVTSFAMVGDRQKVLAAGADDYIPKPIDTRELLVRVKRLLSE